MPRRRRRLQSSWQSLLGKLVPSAQRDVDRANVVGSAPIIAGTGFVLSRTVAIAIADASALTFLWGLVIGLAFATAGVVFLLSTETDTRRGARTVRASRVPLATASGVLALSLLTGAVLGALL
ncbi:hypothetical protein [Halococcus saccharolyticus]|uniref:Uncharacterized protein n=1 Tax=Halococcus saccharolyticus DSM 5350 TaxID=1227455 RepID=M0MJX5_9EURY|nr:hypothetical protein [Halococcus saccharolyticus]EMA45009.1 hypothetical protein C449_10139 [Halococcus saccharolyticus DSM 5350]